jgi:hypothetical protein
VKPPSVGQNIFKAKPPSVGQNIFKAKPPSVGRNIFKAKPPSLGQRIFKAKPPSAGRNIFKEKPPSMGFGSVVNIDSMHEEILCFIDKCQRHSMVCGCDDLKFDTNSKCPLCIPP